MSNACRDVKSLQSEPGPDLINFDGSAVRGQPIMAVASHSGEAVIAGTTVKYYMVDDEALMAFASLCAVLGMAERTVEAMCRLAIALASRVHPCKSGMEAAFLAEFGAEMPEKINDSVILVLLRLEPRQFMRPNASGRPISGVPVGAANAMAHLILSAEREGKLWANQRHYADACHQYQGAMTGVGAVAHAKAVCGYEVTQASVLASAEVSGAIAHAAEDAVALLPSSLTPAQYDSRRRTDIALRKQVHAEQTFETTARISEKNADAAVRNSINGIEKAAAMTRDAETRAGELVVAQGRLRLDERTADSFDRAFEYLKGLLASHDPHSTTGQKIVATILALFTSATSPRSEDPDQPSLFGGIFKGRAQ